MTCQRGFGECYNASDISDAIIVTCIYNKFKGDNSE